ncbi:hypothetical protein SOASR014_41920 [Pectobacterium carotovorum subsp. carotovorum]|nr:hypothetical protein SOASR014_41920 [Pectobacterium carotovorum subsp. carotovorum]GLX46531.1 hypothetical protein Pcaca01_41990 [Pectobacterium carotovorum subsp. carotovorum]
MSTEQSRADFEAWIINLSKGCADLHVNILGDYDDPVIISYWQAWQASRKAMVVELPDSFDAAMGAYGDTVVVTVSELKKSLRAAGITVKEG